MNTTAYLNLCIDITATPPTVLGAEIHSSEGAFIACAINRVRWVTYWTLKCDSYHQARLELLKSTRGTWVSELLANRTYQELPTDEIGTAL